MKKDLIKLLLLAILLRLLLMPFYFHPDIKTYHFQASFLKQGVWDIYSYLDTSKEKLPLKEEFVYFPLTYIFLGSYQILMSPFLGDGFVSWLSDASAQANERIGVYRYLLILKLPYLFLDLSMAFLLLRFFKDALARKKVFTLWLFNPFSLVLIYTFSNVDIMPVFLTILSLLLIYQKKIILAFLLLGIAAAFKAYPILLLPFLLIKTENFKQALLGGIVAIGTLAIIIAPFWSVAFQKAAFVSGLTTRIVFPGLSIGFGQTLMAAVMAIFGLIFYGALRKDKALNKNAAANILYYYLAVFLLLFSFIHFHIQWLLWMIPFVIILLTLSDRLKVHTIFLVTLAFTIPLLYEDKSMTIGLLSAVSPLFNLIPIPFAAVSRFYDPYIVQSVLHSMLVGGSLVLIWSFLNGEHT